MAYSKTTWVDGATALSAEHMNHIEDGIAALDTGKVDKEAGKSLTSNDFTNTLKTKLDGVATGAEVNQNAFSSIDVVTNSGLTTTTISASSKTDTFKLYDGTYVRFIVDTVNKKITPTTTGLVLSSNVGSANGVCPLNASGKIDSSYLPEYNGGVS